MQSSRTGATLGKRGCSWGARSGSSAKVNQNSHASKATFSFLSFVEYSIYSATLVISGINLSGRDARSRTSDWQTCLRTEGSSSEARLNKHAIKVSIWAKRDWEPIGTKEERHEIA